MGLSGRTMPSFLLLISPSCSGPGCLLLRLLSISPGKAHLKHLIGEQDEEIVDFGGARRSAGIWTSDVAQSGQRRDGEERDSVKHYYDPHRTELCHPVRWWN